MTKQEYLILHARLIHVRWKHRGGESTEEDALLDRMEVVWWKLTDDERAELDATELDSGLMPTQDRCIFVDTDVSLVGKPPPPPREPLG